MSGHQAAPTLLGALLAGLLLLAPACDDGYDGPPEAVLFTLAPDEIDLEDGSPIRLLIGTQFGVMVQVGARMRGLDPEEPTFEWVVRVAEEELARQRFRGRLKKADGMHVLDPVLLILEGLSGDDVEGLVGERVEVEVTIVDRKGQQVEEMVDCVAAP